MPELTHQPCHMCGSSNAYSFNTDKLVGYCHSCGKGSTKGPEDVPINQVQSQVPTQSYHPIRGLTEATLKQFGCSGTEDYHDYYYPSGGYKRRTHVGKKFTAHNISSDEFFGMNLFPAGSSKKLTITEGEIDAMSVWQMLGGVHSQYVNPVVSLPSATPSKKLWANTKKYLDNFQEIILCVDNDGPGNDIADKITRMFPNKVKRLELGQYKDANEMLCANEEASFKSSWWSAPKSQPNNVYTTYDDFITLFNEAPSTSFVELDFPAFDNLVGGIPMGHYTLLKARTGIGKTEVTRFIEDKFLAKEVPFACWHLEEPALRSILGLVSYDLDDNLTRKDLIDDKGKKADVLASIAQISNTDLYHQFYMNEDCTTEDLINQCNFMQAAYDIKFVIVEPVQDILNIGGDEHKEAALADLATRISKLAANTGLGIIMVAHTNDDNEIKYCRMLGQRASLVINLDRDKYADTIIEQNTTRLFVEKNRPSSQEGPAGELLFDPDTFKLSVL